MFLLLINQEERETNKEINNSRILLTVLALHVCIKYHYLGNNREAFKEILHVKLKFSDFFFILKKKSVCNLNKYVSLSVNVLRGRTWADKISLLTNHGTWGKKRFVGLILK